ncbi:MAG: hypothetical protein ACTSQ5_10190 [Promethearchaeota archaeon]
MKKPIFPLAVLLILISISTITALTTNNFPKLVDGQDCVQYHNNIYIKTTPQLNYGGAAHPGEELEFSIAFQITTRSMIFNAVVELDGFPEELTLHESQSVQNKSDFSGDNFTPTWIISSNVEGNFTFNIISTVFVEYSQYHTEYNATYEYRHTGSFQVLENPLESPYLIEDLPEEIISAPINWKNAIGQILGFLSTLLVYLCIQLGIPGRKTWIRKKMGWSAKKCKDIHCDLGYLATASIILHNIILSQTAIWGLYFKWFQFYPTFYTYNDGLNNLSVGLDMAVFGSLLFIIATITGIFFKQIARKLGYRIAIFSQQISYLALFFSVIHAFLNGSWTIDSPILLILQTWVLFEVFISRIVAYSNSRDLKEKKIKPTSDYLDVSEQKLIEISQDIVKTDIKEEHGKSSIDKRGQ